MDISRPGLMDFANIIWIYWGVRSFHFDHCDTCMPDFVISGNCKV
jgi:hypothetical protein